MTTEPLKTVERNINQLRGYFIGESNKRVSGNALRMLDEIEIILKKVLEK